MNQFPADFFFSIRTTVFTRKFMIYQSYACQDGLKRQFISKFSLQLARDNRAK